MLADALTSVQAIVALLSGKIMRRVLAAISNTMDIGDVMTLANPDIVEEIRVMVQGKEKVATKTGPADIACFGEEG